MLDCAEHDEYFGFSRKIFFLSSTYRVQLVLNGYRNGLKEYSYKLKYVLGLL